MKIGSHQNMIGVHFTPQDNLKYVELKAILKGDDFKAILSKHDFKGNVVSLMGIDACSACADLLDFKPEEVKLGDLVVLFRRLPHIQEKEAELMTPRDIADKFLVAARLFVAERDKDKVEKPEKAAAA